MRATTANLAGPREPRCHHADGPEPPAHVRPVRQQNLERRQVRDGAAEFKALIDAHPDEQALLPNGTAPIWPRPRDKARGRDGARFDVPDHRGRHLATGASLMKRLDTGIDIYLGD